jgi:hypothetical protein
MLKYNTERKNKELYDLVFRNEKDINAEEFTIVTGYVGPVIATDLKNLGFQKIKLIVGMYGNNISKILHLELKKIQKDNPNIEIFYTKQQVHSKFYIWHNGGSVQEFALGSANFSGSALINNFYRETLYLFNLDENYNSILDYINALNDLLIPIEDFEGTLELGEQEQYNIVEQRKISLSFLTNRGTNQKNIVGISTSARNTGMGSMLNWGFSKGLPLLSDAYIPISSQFIQNNLGLIPPKSKKENIPVEVIWDDGEKMIMLLEGNYMGRDGKLYPKQIGAYGDKSKLGVYLRKRISKKIGKNMVFTSEEIEYVKKFKSGNIPSLEQDMGLYNSIKSKLITKDILGSYGRTDISITKIQEGTYRFDFSV